jgi:polysaccharide export outer membrane protein
MTSSRARNIRPLLFAILLPLAGCFHQPSDGPLAEEIAGEATQTNRYPYHLVELQPDLLSVLSEGDYVDRESFIRDLGAAEIKVGPGDTLTITVVEPGAGGLFTPPPSNGVIGGDQGAKVVPLPAIRVDETGRINVPFAGDLNVRGRTPNEIARMIEAGLHGQAITPHVMVSLETKTSRFSVSGTVKSPGLFQMDEHGVTLLDAIAEAGGAINPPTESVVQLSRGGRVHLVRHQTLLDYPDTDVHVQPGDIIHVYEQPRTYLMLGAMNKVSRETLPRERLSLAAAIAKAGGLIDARADSAALFLLRYETRKSLERIVAIEAKVARRRGETIPGTLDERTARLPEDAEIPVIYVLNVRSGTGLFLADRVAVREKDMLYVANTRSIQFQKYISIYKDITGPLLAAPGAGASGAKL